MARKDGTIFDKLKRDYGIAYEWQADQLGMSHNNFFYYRKNNCLTDAQRARFEQALRQAGAELAKFSLPPKR